MRDERPYGKGEGSAGEKMTREKRTEDRCTPTADVVVVEGINARGFGTVPKAVMRDPELPVEAKGIYAYLCSFAGAGQAAFPSRKTMLAELGLSKDRFYKYREMLIARGLVRVERRSAGSVVRPVRTNVYILSSTLPDCYSKKAPAPSSGDVGGGASSQVAKNVLETRTSEEGFPQSPVQEECPGFQDVLEPGTVSCPENQDTAVAQITRSSAETTDAIKNSPINNSYPTIQGGCSIEELTREFDELSAPDLTPNRNAVHMACAPYLKLRESFSAETIFAAWRRRQATARESGWDAKYFPQLARWLEDPGHDGARCMCETERMRIEGKVSAEVSALLSFDERYMRLHGESKALAALAEEQGLTEEDSARLERLHAAMAAAREAALEDVLERRRKSPQKREAGS
ncbi:MAG: helix-turn-helix domain-containing protein [Eggerthellaceae bacterium]|nr:helix-turn-helix domain-containing protein [Eggerthellaceae bacterium]